MYCLTKDEIATIVNSSPNWRIWCEKEKIIEGSLNNETIQVCLDTTIYWNLRFPDNDDYPLFEIDSEFLNNELMTIYNTTLKHKHSQEKDREWLYMVCGWEL